MGHEAQPLLTSAIQLYLSLRELHMVRCAHDMRNMCDHICTTVEDADDEKCPGEETPTSRQRREQARAQ